MFKKISSLLISLFTATTVSAAIKSQDVEYKSPDGKVMQGFVAYDDANSQAVPGIIIVPDWMGVSQFAKDKALKLANEGYVAFVADVYGKGIRPKNTEEARQQTSQFISVHGDSSAKENRPLLRQRIRAAYDTLTNMKQVNPQQIVAMGYCFGGTTVLELARSGAPVVGTVTFHGGLATPTPQDAKNIHGKVLVLHGADDPMVPPKDVAAFKDEMKNANVDMEFVVYPGAVHGFTNPAAGTDNSKGIAYNAQADKNSWQKFEDFLKKVFNK